MGGIPAGAEPMKKTKYKDLYRKDAKGAKEINETFAVFVSLR